ncbi:hypothetical protein NLI96_g400 [Meripilus lineatus]|uniref:Pseudouridine synthase I TruA alpha/beta domain-containing protein n=1 Tax=Meripilus lineatus TaxID=2056292 RepID=A0AAD5VCC6_9APHY|nr:hypothetical protein NLI96_g400 [Physisporinus lineatus]
MGEDITRPPKRRKLDEKESSCEDGPSDPQKKGQSGQVSNGADVTVQGDTGISEGTSKGAERGKKKDKTMSRSEYRRQGKGRRRGTRNQDDQTEAAQSNEPKAPRLPKRQCALLIGFCGAGYNGMQIQPENAKVRTIEGTLFDALVKVGAVSQDNADDPVKVNLGRAARTDAGVHAAGNIVSMKMITQIPGVDDIVARVNDELPPEIRLWSYVRVQNSFNARATCESRKYTYFFPSYLLIPPKPGSGLHRIFEQHFSEYTRAEPHAFWSECPLESTPQEDLGRKRNWRAGSDIMETLRTIAQKYNGTHNFHNFTVGRDFSDRSTIRFMKSIDIADPVVYGDTEWISVLFHGQSFMLHQARVLSRGNLPTLRD